VVDDGQTYAVFFPQGSGQQSIGYILRWRGSLLHTRRDGSGDFETRHDFDWQPVASNGSTTPNPPMPAIHNGEGQGRSIHELEFPIQAQIRFVKLNEFPSPDNFQFSFNAARFPFSIPFQHPTEGTVIRTYPDTLANVAADVRFIVGTCRTPDVTVPLGLVPFSEFSGIGSGPPPVPFEIRFNECRTIRPRIGYTLFATGDDPTPANGILPLDSTSSAAGFGVQILDAASDPVTFGETKTIPYSNDVPDYRVLLQARIIQTALNPSAGTVRAAMIFVVSFP